MRLFGSVHSAHSDTQQGKVVHVGRIHDVILFYTKTEATHREEIYQPYNDTYIDKFYRHIDEDGRIYQLGDLSLARVALRKEIHSTNFRSNSILALFTRKHMQALYDQGRIVQTSSGSVPRYKRYLDEMPGVPLARCLG